MLKTNKILNTIIAGVVSFGLIFPTPLLAQDSEEDAVPEVQLDLRITSLSQGEVAPFTGLLLTPDAMVKIRFDHQLELSLLQNDLQYQLRLSQGELETQQRLWAVERDLYTTQIASRNQHIENLEDVLVKRKDLTPLWVALGFVGGSLATIGITYAVTGAVQ